MNRRQSKLAWSDGDARQVLDRYEMAVRISAKRLMSVAALGQAVDEDDLRAEGRVAVLEALSTYRGFGMGENSWVRIRIKQRMIDAIRRLDLRTRGEMRLVVQRATAPETTRENDDDERMISARRLVSADATSRGSEPLINRMYNSEAPMPDDIATSRDQMRTLLKALNVLPLRQRTAVELALFEGLALREIGDRMGISESRVCQLQKRAVQHLRKSVGNETARTAA